VAKAHDPELLSQTVLRHQIANPKTFGKRAKITDPIGIPRKIIGFQSNLPALIQLFLHGFWH
jgi:hypothetical protein